MGERAWQHDIFRGPSCGRELTYETTYFHLRTWSLTLATSVGA